MLRFFTLRFSLMVITLLVVSLAVFLVTEVLPGDVAQMMLGQEATEANLEKIQQDLDLDRPAPERYLSWIGGVVQGDWGMSYVQKQPISEILGRRITHSLTLALCALLVGIPLAIAAGVWAGMRADTMADRLMTVISLVGISLPEFVTGVVFILLFASVLGWLPASSLVLPGTTPLSRPEILILPAMTLTVVLFAYIMRMTRANVIEVMQSSYLRTAILKGLSTRRVIFRHVLPNAMLPTITIIATSFGWMLGGLIIVEAVFAYPGLGQLLLKSIQNRDIPLLQALALLITTTCMLSNLAADLSYAVLDPRIRRFR